MALALDNLQGWYAIKQRNQTLQTNSPIQTIRIYRQDTGMEFGIEKCAMIIMKEGKRGTIEGIENYKYLGIMETDTINVWMMVSVSSWKKKKERSISEKKKISRDQSLPHKSHQKI